MKEAKSCKKSLPRLNSQFGGALYRRLDADVKFVMENRSGVIFGAPGDWKLYRYCTWEEAEQGHAAIVERCRVRDAGLKDEPLVFKAGELAQLTVKKGPPRAVRRLLGLVYLK